MTAEERREWQSLRDDDAASRFIAAFHERRSSDFSGEVVKRASVVNEHLTVGEAKAANTLRGRLVILLGAPADLRVRHLAKPYRGSLGVPLTGKSGAVFKGRPTGKGMGAEGWLEYTFRFAPRPDLGIGPDGWTVVIEADVISGKDALKDARDKKKLEAVLDAAARVSLRP